MAQMRANDTATKIQIQNLRIEVESMKSVIGDLVIALKDSNPEFLIKYVRYTEKVNGWNKKYAIW